MNEDIRTALTQGGVIDITTTGRKSGEPRRIEIVFHPIDGHVYISGFPRPRKRNWLANLEAQPRFTFHLKQGHLKQGVKAGLPATARPITDATEQSKVLQVVSKTWERSDVDEMLRYSPLVEVTFDEA